MGSRETKDIEVSSIVGMKIFIKKKNSYFEVLECW